MDGIYWMAVFCLSLCIGKVNGWVGQFGNPRGGNEKIKVENLRNKNDDY